MTTPDVPVHLGEADQFAGTHGKSLRLSSRLHPIVLLLLAMAGASLAVGIVLEFGAWTHEEVIRGPFRTEPGTRTAWVPVGPEYSHFSCCIGARADDDVHHAASSLRASLNGRELGPAHMLHDDIRSGMTSGFSHWNDNTLRFFIPESVANDQTTALRVRYPVQYSIGFFDLNALIVIVLIAMAGVRLGAHPILWFVPTVSLSIYIVAVYLFESPPVPLIAPDTASYWYATPDHYIYNYLYMDAIAERPLGYTALLHTVYGLTGNLKYIPAIQSGIYCVAVLAYQTAIWRLTRNIFFATAAAAVLLLYHALLVNSIWALSEQLFIAFLVLHVAAAAWALASRSRAALISTALTAVVIISIRPAGTFVLVALLFFCLFWKGNRIFAVRWVMLPLAIGMTIFMGVGFAVRGIAMYKLPGFGAFPNVAYLYDGSGNIPPIAKQTIAAFLQPYIRGHKEAELGGIVAVTTYEANNFNAITYGLPPRLSKVLPGRDVSALEGRLAIETITRHPFEYVRHVAMTFSGGLTYALHSHPIDANDIQEFYRQMSKPTQVVGKLVGGLQSFNVDSDGSSYGLVRDYPIPELPDIGRWHRWALMLFGIIALVSTFAAVFQKPSGLTFFTAYTSTLAIGGYLFVAATTVFIDRYAMPLDAFIIITLGNGVLEAWQVLHRKLRALAESQPQIATVT